MVYIRVNYVRVECIIGYILFYMKQVLYDECLPEYTLNVGFKP